MVVRQRRKKNKLRGHRYHGGGDTKNRRGAGSRGGVGRAGSHKHKFSKYYADFGTKRKLKVQEKAIAFNLGYISDHMDDWVTAGKAKSENGFIVLNGTELGFGKILGTGNIKGRIKVENVALTKKAAEKILAAGGEIPGEEAFEAVETETEEVSE
ncbi:MAG: 50S ribosomal protein L15 [Candidatus Diapherotrites archaeon CG11_big_fil_rev_8_21_14_0_20_37_9]|nr:MAG: 50S ribosomal protein L15 [Candidatus Diapherotrites archaeon CG11_big_fil_rev_8_21_14_0_20_37_9]